VDGLLVARALRSVNERGGLGLGKWRKVWGFGTRILAPEFGSSGLGFCVRCGTRILAVWLWVLSDFVGFLGAGYLTGSWQ